MVWWISMRYMNETSAGCTVCAICGWDTGRMRRMPPRMCLPGGFGQGGKAFASEEHEKAYFLKAACNECANMKHSLWRRNRVDFDDLPEAVTAVEDAEPEDGAILRGLPRRYREVLYLYYYEGLSAAETAKILGRNESTVRTQLQKGRERLKKNLTEGEDRA